MKTKTIAEMYDEYCDVRNGDFTWSYGTWVTTELQQHVEKLVEAAQRSLIKHQAYVGVCNDDKELTNAILPMLKEALKPFVSEE